MSRFAASRALHACGSMQARCGWRTDGCGCGRFWAVAGVQAATLEWAHMCAAHASAVDGRVCNLVPCTSEPPFWLGGLLIRKAMRRRWSI